MVSKREQVVGLLVGGAIGDALGAPFEGGGPAESRQLPVRGDITDDTELTLATCEAIIERDGQVDLESVAARYVSWFQSGRVHGAGSSTTKALRDLAAGAHWALAGARGEFAAGAGAAMRVGPLAFLVDLNADDDRTLLRDFCRITHHHDEAYAGAVAVVAALQAAAAGQAGPPLLRDVEAALPDSNVRDRISNILKTPSPTTADVIAVTGTTGYVASVVPFAISLAAASRDTSEALTDVVRSGGDTDTAGAIVGSIHGVRLGVRGLPEDLADGVKTISVVRDVAAKFADIVEGRQN